MDPIPAPKCQICVNGHHSGLQISSICKWTPFRLPNVLSGLDSGPQMLKCLKRTPSQPSNVQNAAGDATWATLISRCPKGRPSVSLMPNGAPPRLLLTDLATPAGTGIDVDKISSQLEQFAWQGCQALSGAAHLGPNLAPKVKFGPKFGPQAQN